MEGAEWLVPPARETISPPRGVNELLSRETATKELVMTLGNLIKDYPQYRKVRGDGNCFYRAVGFNWMRECNLTNFDEVFPAVDHISLTLCKPSTVPEEFQQKYTDSFLKTSFRKGWEKLFGKPVKDKQESLAVALNKYFWLDFLIVNYFRCLNHNTIQYNKDFYKSYSSKSVSTELARISSYGEEAEGVQIQAMSYSLNSQIQIYMVTRQAIYPIVYTVKGKTRMQSVLFRPGHYDLLCPRTFATSNRAQKVHFKQQTQEITPNSIERAYRSVSPPPSKILKKTTTAWRTPRVVEEQTAKRFDLVNWLFQSHSKTRLLQIMLVMLIAILSLWCLHKYHHSYGGDKTIHHRSYWPWREVYLSEHRRSK